MKKYNKDLQSSITKQDKAHEDKLIEDRNYIHINVGFNQWDNNYNCTALNVSRQHAVYAYKNQHALYFELGASVYVVTSNFGITHAQAMNLCDYHYAGKFVKEDTASWD